MSLSVQEEAPTISMLRLLYRPLIAVLITLLWLFVYAKYRINGEKSIKIIY